MKEKIVFIFMIFICAGILIGSQLKNDLIITPEDTILGIIKAAENNNTKEYLAYFCDELRLNLEDQIDHMGEDFFNRVMKNYENLMGVAISDKREINRNMINLRVEFVFDGYDEIRSYLFKKIGNDWKIKMITNINNS